MPRQKAICKYILSAKRKWVVSLLEDSLVRVKCRPNQRKFNQTRSAHQCVESSS